MFCSNCKTQNDPNDTFCKNCGYKLNNTIQPVQQQSTVNSVQSNTSNGGLNSTYVENAVNPNMKKWAILSIIVPIIAMVWYWFIGLSFYVAIFIAGAGFEFARKGEMSNKKLAIIGKVLNGMLGALAIIMLIIYIVGSVAK